MHFEPDHIYHLYSRGNNKTRIFFNEANYLFFLSKVKEEWLQYCDIINYTLMPNHFHFTLKPNAEGCVNLSIANKSSHLQQLSKSIGKTLSSYAQAMNNQNQTTGSLFQKKTRAKCLTNEALCRNGLAPKDYLENCFRYIHNNPVAALLVDHPKFWRWSSWHEYFGNASDGICNLNLAAKLLSSEILKTPGAGGGGLDNLAVEGIW